MNLFSAGSQKPQLFIVDCLVSILVFLGIAPTVFAADDYPGHPVRIIAPQAPGGGVDIVGRIIADQLRIATGQPF